MVNLLTNRNYKFLQDYHFHLLNDLSMESNKNKKNSLKIKIFKIIVAFQQNMFRSLGNITENEHFYIFWRILKFIFIVIQSFLFLP